MSVEICLGSTLDLVTHYETFGCPECGERCQGHTTHRYEGIASVDHKPFFHQYTIQGASSVECLARIVYGALNSREMSRQVPIESKDMVEGEEGMETYSESLTLQFLYRKGDYEEFLLGVWSYLISPRYLSSRRTYRRKMRTGEEMDPWTMTRGGGRSGRKRAGTRKRLKAAGLSWQIP